MRPTEEQYYKREGEYDGPQKIVIWYKNLEQFITDISTEDYPQMSSVKEGRWSGSESFKQSITDAREGLNLGAVDLGINQKEKLHDYINRATYAVSGGTVDVGKFLTGEPECMIDFQTEDAPKFVTINVDVSESCGTPDEVFRRKSIAVGCLVDELENNGFRVKLNVVTNCDRRNGFKKLVGVICIKDYQEKLSVAQITGCVSQGFFRRLLFAFMEKHSPTNPDNDAYGYPSTNYDGLGLDGVLIKNTRNDRPLNSDRDIAPYIEHYTKEIYALPQI